MRKNILKAALLCLTLPVTVRPASLFAQDHVPLLVAPVARETSAPLAGLPEVIPPKADAATSPGGAVQPEPIESVHEKSRMESTMQVPHQFWDRENTVLFATVGAAATADFFTTRANLASGGKELNPVTRVFAGSTPALATNFALETMGVIGVSYLFHRTGHHSLERMTSFVNIGFSTAAVGYGLTHR
jgi:hypothetical protein